MHGARFGYTSAMPLVKPALDPLKLEPRTTSGYPEAFQARVIPREKRSIAKALGLRNLGANLTTLAPGKQSALRHYHSQEDELVFVLEGEMVLITDEGEQLLTQGMCAGFPAGAANGHHLTNRTSRPVVYLELSSIDSNDTVTYPDDDLAYVNSAAGPRFTRKDGTPYE